MIPTRPSTYWGQPYPYGPPPPPPPPAAAPVPPPTYHHTYERCYSRGRRGGGSRLLWFGLGSLFTLWWIKSKSDHHGRPRQVGWTCSTSEMNSASAHNDAAKEAEQGPKSRELKFSDWKRTHFGRSAAGERDQERQQREQSQSSPAPSVAAAPDEKTRIHDEHEEFKHKAWELAGEGLDGLLRGLETLRGELRRANTGGSDQQETETEEMRKKRRDQATPSSYFV